MDAYDAVPYDSLPIRETHPEHLAVLGQIYGLASADPQRARILELGCAGGGNLIPMAFYMPETQCVGIDLSAQQIAQGRERIAALGIENIALREGDIAQLADAELGEFDYIIAHGVYSWVPEAVREALLALCRAHLAPNGIAYLSYNALPGWRMRGMLRDIARYAAREVATPAAQAQAVRQGFARLQAALGDLQALSARYLRAEIPALLESPDSYLLHEYLAEENAAFLFSEFYTAAERHRLSYLCDAELHSEFPQLLGDAAAAALADIDDAIALGQWLDFVRARNLRRSLLVRDDAQLGAGIDLERFERCAFFADLQAPPKLDLRREKGAPFQRPDGERVTVRHPLTKAALLELHQRHPEALALPALLPAAAGRLHAAGADAFAHQTEAFLAEWFALFVQGAVRARVAPLTRSRPPHAKPRANRFVRVQLAAGEHRVATPHHDNVVLDAAAAALLATLDGTRPVAALAGHEARLVGGLMRQGLLE